MTIYVVVLITAFLMSFAICPNLSSRRKKIYVIIMFLLIIIFSSLRKYTVGIDLESHYYYSFIKMTEMTLSEAINTIQYDEGYIFFYKIIQIITNNPQWMIAIHSIIVFSIIGRFIYKNSENVLMSTVLIISFNYWFLYMNIMRQALAIVIALYAIEIFNSNIKKGVRYFIYITLTIYSLMIHPSAIVAIVYLILKNVQFKKNTLLLIIVVTLISFGLYSQIFKMASSFISSSSVTDYTSRYEDDITGLNVMSLYRLSIPLASFVIAYITIIYNKNKNKKSNQLNDKEYLSDDYLIYMVYVLVLFNILRIKMNIFGRIAEYFAPFSWILLPRAINRIKEKNMRMLLKFLVYIFLVSTFIWIGNTSAEKLYGTVPYEFFWN